MNFDILNGVKHLVDFVNDNWTLIVIVIGMVITLINRIRAFVKMSEEDRINSIKVLIKETLLEKVTNAEIEYEDWIKAGAIKRSQVINEIYEQYPTLYQVVDQEELIKWIDTEIELALKTMRDIFTQNTEE